MWKYSYRLLAWTALAFAALALVSTPTGARASSALVTVHAENDLFRHPTNAATLGELLDELSISLPPDYLEELGLRLDAPVPTELSLPQLVVVRMSKVESMPPPIQYKVFPTQREPRVEVLETGREGARELRSTRFFLFGNLVGERTSTKVVQKPVPRVVAIYRAVAPDYVPSYDEILRQRHLPSRELKPPLRYRRKLTMEATAYEPGPTSNGIWSTGYTAIGLKAGPGVVAVDPDVILLRSRLYIEGYGYAIAGDVGGAIKGNRIDLGFNTVDEAIKFGRRDVVVYVLD